MASNESKLLSETALNLYQRRRHFGLFLLSYSFKEFSRFTPAADASLRRLPLRKHNCCVCKDPLPLSPSPSLPIHPRVVVCYCLLTSWNARLQCVRRRARAFGIRCPVCEADSTILPPSSSATFSPLPPDPRFEATVSRILLTGGRAAVWSAVSERFPF